MKAGMMILGVQIQQRTRRKMMVGKTIPGARMWSRIQLLRRKMRMIVGEVDGKMTDGIQKKQQV